MRSLVVAALVLGAFPGARAQAPAAPSFTTRPGFLPGYLSQKELPDSLALLPPPPAAGSAALSEVAPDRGDALMVRGQAFGQSRIVCNAHWESDVVEGRVVGAATVARLHSNAAFLADLDAAKAEVAAARAKGLKPTRDCGAEAAAMALDPESAP